jgi:uncharacterized coiled-coil protein SlyX
VENKINAEDLVKNQDIDASHWAAAFMQLFGSDLRQIDEGLMISWFANSIMVTHDKISNEKDKQIKKLTDENYEIRCQRQSWMNKIDEANYTENSALQQLKDFKQENNNLKSRLLDFEGRTYSENQEIAALKSKLAKAKMALEFYADDFNWLYNQIKKSDCEEIKFNHVLKKPIPKGLEFEAGGKLARQALTEIGGEI